MLCTGSTASVRPNDLIRVTWSYTSNNSLRQQLPALKELTSVHLRWLHELIYRQWQFYLNLLRNCAVAAITTDWKAVQLTECIGCVNTSLSNAV